MNLICVNEKTVPVLTFLFQVEDAFKLDIKTEEEDLNELIEVTNADISDNTPQCITKCQHQINVTQKHSTPVGSDNFRDLIHLPKPVQMQLCAALVNGRITLKEYRQLIRHKCVLHMIHAAFMKIVDPKKKICEW